MRFFTSDTHFNSQSTLEMDQRPFSSTKQFDRYVLKLWNKQTKKGDVIYHLGDWGSCSKNQMHGWEQAYPYVKKLKAKVILVIGNNEERIVKFFFSNNFDDFRNYCKNLGFLDVVKNCEIEVAGKKFFMTHKPKDCKPEVLNLFGHIHRTGGIYRSFGFSMCCDLNHFYLQDENAIANFLDMKEKYWDLDENLKIK